MFLECFCISRHQGAEREFHRQGNRRHSALSVCLCGAGSERKLDSSQRLQHSGGAHMEAGINRKIYSANKGKGQQWYGEDKELYSQCFLNVV